MYKLFFGGIGSSKIARNRLAAELIHPEVVNKEIEEKVASSLTKNQRNQAALITRTNHFRVRIQESSTSQKDINTPTVNI